MGVSALPRPAAQCECHVLRPPLWTLLVPVSCLRGLVRGLLGITLCTALSQVFPGYKSSVTVYVSSAEDEEGATGPSNGYSVRVRIACYRRKSYIARRASELRAFKLPYATVAAETTQQPTVFHPYPWPSILQPSRGPKTRAFGKRTLTPFYFHPRIPDARPAAALAGREQKKKQPACDEGGSLGK